MLHDKKFLRKKSALSIAKHLIQNDHMDEFWKNRDLKEVDYE